MTLTPTRRRGAGLMPWAFLAPALLLFLYFKFIPMAENLRMSFFKVQPFLGNEFLGLDNYRRVLTEESFLSAMGHSVALAAGTTTGSLLLGFALALLVEGKARHLWLIRTAAFLPVVVTMAAVAEVWRIIYHPGESGTLNSVLGLAGVAPQPFLADEDSSLLSIMGMNIWRGAPYDMMIFLAGLVGVDRTLYEASAVDGAPTWRRVWHITLPALRPVFWIFATLAAIRGLRVFVEVYVLTNGGPNGSSEVLMTLIYKAGFQRNDLGVAAAGCVTLFAVTLALTVVVRLARRRRDV